MDNSYPFACNEKEKTLLKRLYQMIMKFKKAKGCMEFDTLTEGERGILFQLYLHPEGVFSGELSERVGVGTGRIGNALKHLEKDGLIKREREAYDHRKVNVLLTDKGYAKMKDINDRVYKEQLRLIRKIGVDKMNTLLNDLDQVISVLVEVSEEEKKEGEKEE